MNTYMAFRVITKHLFEFPKNLQPEQFNSLLSNIDDGTFIECSELLNLIDISGTSTFKIIDLKTGETTPNANIIIPAKIIFGIVSTIDSLKRIDWISGIIMINETHFLKMVYTQPSLGFGSLEFGVI